VKDALQLKTLSAAVNTSAIDHLLIERPNPVWSADFKKKSVTIQFGHSHMRDGITAVSD
jgi:hypothetical protein